MATEQPINMDVVNAHKLIAAVVYKLGKEHGVDPVAIRCALAVNLINVCAASSRGGENQALSDVSEAIAMRKEGVPA